MERATGSSMIQADAVADIRQDFKHHESSAARPGHRPRRTNHYRPAPAARQARPLLDSYRPGYESSSRYTPERRRRTQPRGSTAAGDRASFRFASPAQSSSSQLPSPKRQCRQHQAAADQPSAPSNDDTSPYHLHSPSHYQSLSDRLPLRPATPPSPNPSPLFRPPLSHYGPVTRYGNLPSHGHLIRHLLPTAPTATPARACLMGLPAELRIMILEYTVTSQRPIAIDNGSHEPPVTFANKQLRDESLPIYYRNNFFIHHTVNYDPFIQIKMHWKDEELYMNYFITFMAHQVGESAPHWTNLKAWLKAYRDGETGFRLYFPRDYVLDIMELVGMTIAEMFDVVDQMRSQSWDQTLQAMENLRRSLVLFDRRWALT